MRGGVVASHPIEERKKGGIGLAIHFHQFNRHQPYVGKHVGIEKVELLIVAAKYLFHVARNHGLKLKHVAHQHQLLPAEGLAGVVGINA